MTDVDRLPPTQYLCLDVLTARFRLGEPWWHFPSQVGPALRRLESAGLVYREHADEPGWLKACLTDRARSLLLDGRYGSANKVEQMRSGLKLIAEFAGAQSGLVPGMEAVAEIARKALAGEQA